MEMPFSSNHSTASETSQAQLSRESGPAGVSLPSSIPCAARPSAEGRKLQSSRFMTSMVWLKDLKQPVPLTGRLGGWRSPLFMFYLLLSQSVKMMKTSPSRHCLCHTCQPAVDLTQGQAGPNPGWQDHSRASSEP